MRQRRLRQAREALARFKSSGGVSAHRRGGPPPDRSFWSAFAEVGLRASGELKKPYAEHPGVFRAVSVIQQDMGAVPWVLYSGATEDGKKEVQSGPWYDLFSDPNPDMDSGMLFSLTRTWNLLDGEVFWVLRKRDGNFTDPREIPGILEPVPAAEMVELVNSATGAWVGWEWQAGRKKIALRRDQVVQFRMFANPYAPRRGIAPLSPVRRSVRTDHKAHVWNESSLDNNAEPGVILESDKDVYPTQEQVDQMRQTWNDMHAGAGNARRPAVLAGGMKVSTLGWNPKDMEFNEQRKWSRFEIASAYGVPLMLMGDMSEVHSKESARTVLKLYWENTVIPHLRNEQKTLDTQLFLGRGQGDTASSQRVWCEPDTSGIAALQTEENEKRDNAQKDRALGFSLNEINLRHGLGYEPEQPAGDVGLVSGGLAPVTVVGGTLDDAGDIAADVLAASPLPEQPEGMVAEEAVLNGAQIQAALAIVQAVASGDLPRDTGLGMIEVLFNLTPEQALAIMGSAGTTKPTTPNPKPGSAEEPPASESPSEPEEPEDDEEEEPEEEEDDDAGRSVTDERHLRWVQYIRGIQKPGEVKMRAAVLAWMRDIRRDTLRFIEKAARKAALASAGQRVEGEGDDEEKPPQGSLTPTEIEIFFASKGKAWDDAIVAKTKPIDSWIAHVSLKRLAEDVGKEMPNETSPEMLEFLDTRAASKVTHVSKTVQESLRKELSAGAAAKENVTDLQMRVKNVMNASASRSLTIARTEAGAASTGSRFVGAKELGIQRISWLSARDDNVRDSHQDMDGEVVAWGEKFPNGLRYPLDSDATDAAEVCNCRCDWIAERSGVPVVE